MINATKVHHVYDEESPSKPWSAIKRQISDSPLTALGVAAGAGLLAYGLLKPRSKPHQNFIGKAVNAIGSRKMRSRASSTLKSVVGSLALGYFNRKMSSKMPWR